MMTETKGRGFCGFVDWGGKELWGGVVEGI